MRVEVTPPRDCMTWISASTPKSRMRPSKSAMKRSTVGRMYASKAVTTVRSYSRKMGLTSEDSDTETSGQTSLMISRVRTSWISFLKA